MSNIRSFFVAFLAAAGTLLPAQTPTQTQPKPPAFDVASVKQNKSIGDGRSHIWSSSENGNFKTQNVSMKGLLEFAYGMPQTQIVGALDSVSGMTFDIDAKLDEEAETRFEAQTTFLRRTQKPEMLQTLLSERFHLMCHRENREMMSYALIPAKDGSKLKPAQKDGLRFDVGYGKLRAEGATLEQLAGVIAQRLNEPVVDASGITGRYDMEINFTPPEGPMKLNGQPIPDPPPSIFTAIQEQLGLKLEKRRGPVEVLVIDHVEMPTEN
ncbi:TIGR03435 family protein [Terriglobus albidus]|uniref:TIGR03435 family protein n=1 Tax=Terriglobus albidus TaxID=1592106 RepID=A0A5B9EFU4_9BACT|nr:TIGR03435 family protein [Terriglobus albidus]QEE29995.1 TIGR03435 family protein [Terriglobus albidus]